MHLFHKRFIFWPIWKVKSYCPLRRVYVLQICAITEVHNEFQFGFVDMCVCEIYAFHFLWSKKWTNFDDAPRSFFLIFHMSPWYHFRSRIHILDYSTSLSMYVTSLREWHSVSRVILVLSWYVENSCSGRHTVWLLAI